MRPYTTAQNTVLAGSSYQVSARALVANADGTMIDLTTVGGIDWFDKIDLDTTIDQAVSQATITLRRGAGPTLSLSPLRSDSTVNVNGVGAYAPLIDLGRKIQIDVATTATGVAPVSGDWQPLFLGYIDTIDFGSDPITITARDLGAALVDTWLEADATYGTGPGRSIELVMQDILNAAFGAGVVPLYTPASPGFLITSYMQKSMGVMAALTALVGTIGWDVRYMWDSGTSQFRLTFAQPPRTNTTPIYTFGPSRYIDVKKLTLDRTNIRNAIGVDYPVFDVVSNAEARAQITTVVDTTSVAKYGRRYMGITEPSGSPINTPTKAQNLAAAALADLKTPPAEQEIELHFDWRVELHDLDTFSANGVHYNSDQTWAVAGVRHTLEPTKHRTIITARGAPAGSYLSWIGRGPNGSPVGKPAAPIATITPGANTGSAYLDLTFNATPGVGGSTLLHFKITIKRGGTTTIALDDVVNSLSLPFTDTFTRDPQMALVAMFVVTDAVSGLSSQPAFYTIEAARNYINGSGQPVRGQQFSDGNYAQQALDSSGTRLNSTAVDYGSRPVNTFFGKALPSSPDTGDSIVDGVSYGITSLNQRTGAGRAYNALDSSSIVQASYLDFSRGYTNKSATYLPRTGADPTPLATIVGSIDNSGNAASSMLDSGARPINKFYGKGLAANPDTADSIGDGASYGVVTFNQRTGGGRAYSGLNSSNRLATGVDAGADVIGVPAATLASGASTSLFRETFDSDPVVTGRWSLSGASTAIATQSGIVGPNALSTAGVSNLTFAQKIPYNPSKLHRIRARIRQYADGGTQGVFYVGILGFLATGAAANTNSGAVYVCVSGANLHSADGWVEYTGWFKGASVASTTAASPSTDPTTPAALNVNTVSISPYILLNNSTGNGTQLVDYVEIDVLDEDASTRTYTALNSSNRIADETRLPMVRVNSGGATPFYGTGNTTNPISSVIWNSGSSTYTANIAAFTVYAGSKTISYNSGSITGLFQNLTYYIYCDDPNFAGGSPGYYASTTLYTPTANDGRVYVGAVTTGSGGGSSTTYAGGSAACFEGDTLISMADGSTKPIAEIVPGDRVVSFDPATGVLGTKPVTAVQVHEVARVLTIESEHGRVVTTPEHPFYLEGGTFGAAGWLRHGNYVMRRSQFAMLRAERVLSVNPDTRAVTVYNFEVEDWHTYIANGFAVHNVKLI